MNKELIKQWGESTAYSAKSHFKSADVRRNWIRGLLIINILFAIFSILELGLPILTKILGIISLIASVLLLIYESKEEKNTVKRHMQIGDEYLTIHYELQRIFHDEKTNEEEINSILEKIKKINQKEKPIINQYAKKLAKKAIEEKGEMTKWW